jgi:hypothetical protein
MNGNTLVDITPAVPGDVPSQEEACWSGGTLGLRVVLNNTYGAPWWWQDPDSLAPMIALPNWPTGLKCYTLRSFKQVLVALNITKGNDNYPQMVKWSHPADPGLPPSSWDEADETKDAGETVLAETPGSCVDCVSLRDSNVIYKTDSVWGMQYIGGVFIYRFVKIFGDWGIPNRNCAVEFTAGQHFCFTGSDLYVHDGNTARSVAIGKFKSLVRTITVDQLPTCYVVNNPGFDEVWFCWRRENDGRLGADTALVWNHKDNTMSVRILQDYRYIGTGRVDPNAEAIDTWDVSGNTWDAANVVWAESAQIPAFMRLLGLGPTNLTWVDGTDTMHGPLLLERTYVGIPTRTDKAPDLSAMKFVRRVWPRFVGQTGTQLKVTFGSADSVGEDIKWREPLTFIIGTTRKFDITLSGKVMAIRIEADTMSQPTVPYIEDEMDQPRPKADLPATPVGLWRFNGMDIDVKAAGEM